MTVLQGLNIKVNILRRKQLDDDMMGGSQQKNEVVYSDIPARITQMGTPPILRAQGIENVDNYNCVIQPLNMTHLDLRMDDIVSPQNGQYAGLMFMVTNTHDNPYADLTTDDRNTFRNLSLRYVRDARSIQ